MAENLTSEPRSAEEIERLRRQVAELQEALAKERQRQSAEDLQVRGDEMMRAVYEQAQHLAGIVDLDGNLRYANGTACRMIDAVPADVVGRPFWETPWWTHDPAEQAKLRDGIKQATSGQSVRFETTTVAADGTRRHLAFTLKPMRGAGNRIVFLIAEAYDITERIRAEDELRRNEERFRILSSITTEGVMIHENNIIVEANQAFADVLGLASVQDLIGQDGMKVIQFTPKSQRRLMERMKSGSADAYDIEIVRPDGTIYPAETSGRDIEYQGRPARLVYMRDISERRNAEEALRESERNYREIFNATSDALFIHDETGTIVDVNERMCAMFGCDREEALGRTASEFSLDESPYSENEVREKIRRTEFLGSQTFLWRSKRLDGTLFWSEVALRHCVVAGQTRVIASVRDVSERKEAQDAVASEKQFAEALFESLPGIAYAYDEDGRLVRWNRTYEAVLGRADVDLSSGDWSVLSGICERDRERIAGVFDEVFEKGHGAAEFTVESGDGREIPYFGTGRLAVVAGKRYLVGVGFDISDRVQTEAEKSRLQEQLQHSMKMEAVGQLAGGVAHDFNNLLTVIAGNVELARTDLGPDDPLLSYLDQVDQAAGNAAALTRQLLSFSRRQIIEPRILNLNDLVVNVQKLLVRLIGENITIRTELDEALGAVNVDPAQFEQVLVNLAVNARDAMPDGGQLVIETANVDLAAGDPAQSGNLRTGPFVRLTVTDTGQGMTGEVQRRAFEPFFTTKEKGRGTGLGLATIFGSVEQAGGAIDVRSAVDRGTTFQILLPRKDGGAAALPRDGYTAKLPRGDETVLLVEDDSSVRELTHLFLRRLGYTVFQAASGVDAVALVESHSGRIDLLLTDVVMPGLNGRETAQRLFPLQPDLKVLFTSGYADDVVVHHGVVEENLSFIAKPFDLKHLANKLREVLDSS